MENAYKETHEATVAVREAVEEVMEAFKAMKKLPLRKRLKVLWMLLKPGCLSTK